MVPTRGKPQYRAPAQSRTGILLLRSRFRKASSDIGRPVRPLLGDGFEAGFVDSSAATRSH
jgi:hypothetical protein